MNTNLTKSWGIRMDRRMMDSILIGLTPTFKDIASNHTDTMNCLHRDMIEAMYTCLKYRDYPTAKHSYLMGKCAYELARVLDPEKAAFYFYGGITHDIGKLSMRDYILKGTHQLNIAERQEIREHVRCGVAILTEMEMPQIVRDMALFHHESFDGTGYLFGLLGNEIPLAGRIAAVADVYSAIVTDRPYKPARTRKQALETMSKIQSKFDPNVFKKFLQIVPSINLNDFHGDNL